MKLPRIPLNTQIVESLSGCEMTFLGIPLESSLVQNIQYHFGMSAQLLPAACQNKQVVEVGNQSYSSCITIGKPEGETTELEAPSCPPKA